MSPPLNTFWSSTVKIDFSFFGFTFIYNKSDRFFDSDDDSDDDSDHDSNVSFGEIKNRVNKLFYSLREYEKVQIMCYMHIFNIKKSHLVEAFKKKFNAEINIIEVKYDESYMNNIICKIYNFCLFFKNFMFFEYIHHFL